MSDKLKRDIELTKGSVKKWEGVVNGTQLGWPWTTCPLCQQYFTHEDVLSEQCTGCPVSEKTGQSNCRGTPYTDYSACDTEWFEIELPNERAQALGYAEAELQFLKDLLKELEDELVSIQSTDEENPKGDDVSDD